MCSQCPCVSVRGHEGRAVARAGAAVLVALVLRCVSAASISSATVEHSRAPATMECLSYCSGPWLQRDPADPGASVDGLAKLYIGNGHTWGYMHTAFFDDPFMPMNESLEAHVHTSDCGPGWEDIPTEDDLLLQNDLKFVWRLPPGNESMGGARSRRREFEMQVPWPEDGARSVVVHDIDYAKHLCCNLQSCVPPLHTACSSTCNSWSLLDPSLAAGVSGHAELYSAPEDEDAASWGMIDLTFQAADSGAAIWEDNFTAVLMEGASMWSDASGTGGFSLSLPGNPVSGFMRVASARVDGVQVPAVAPSTLYLNLVILHGSSPIAECTLVPCEHDWRVVPRFMTPPMRVGPGSPKSRGSDGIIYAALGVGAGVVLLGMLCCYLRWYRRPAVNRNDKSLMDLHTTLNGSTGGIMADSSSRMKLIAAGDPERGFSSEETMRDSYNRHSSDYQAAMSHHGAPQPPSHRVYPAMSSAKPHRMGSSAHIQNPGRINPAILRSAEAEAASPTASSQLQGDSSMWLDERAPLKGGDGGQQPTRERRGRSRKAWVKYGRTLSPAGSTRTQSFLTASTLPVPVKKSDLKQQDGSWSKAAYPPEPPEGVQPVEWIILMVDQFIRTKTLFCEKYRLLPGSENRREGDQSVVVFAEYREGRVKHEVAVKFFTSLDVFKEESGRLAQPELLSLMPEVFLEEANEDCRRVSPYNWAVPPFMITEKGMSLMDWRTRCLPEYYNAVQVVMHLAKTVRDLHRSGCVHGDIKPTNIIWSANKGHWKLVDFAGSSQIGEKSRISCTLSWAAPEVVLELCRGKGTMRRDEKVDVWSLGMVLFHVLSGIDPWQDLEEEFFQTHPDPKNCTRDALQRTMVERLMGESSFPWEHPSYSSYISKKLGAFHRGLLRMLSRNPARRPRIREVLAEWDELLSGGVLRE